ncbi:UbiA family prenyltransferase [Methanolobus sp. ZRKC2]|uniref:UbiA family prenyltransferase n=1 Tax=Methanolobus sp. ZRKC2 TaxID=3125783 RepID=UPI00324F1210
MTEFFSFIRFKICLFVTGIGVSGYLLFNSLGFDVVFVTLCCFFAGATGYAYNLITDKSEDLINHKKINRFADSSTGMYLVYIFMLLGGLFSLFLSTSSMFFYLVITILNVSYSRFRLKKRFPLKNIMTGFGLTQVFMIGAANASLSNMVFTYYFIVSLFILLTSLISDLRDFEGDKKTGIKTVPVALGYNFSRKLSFILLFASSWTIYLFGLSGLNTLLIFSIPIAYYLYVDNPKSAHKNLLYSFMALPFGILVL